MTNFPAPNFYDFVDHPLAALNPLDALLGGAMRVWARAAMARICPVRFVAPRFVFAGIGNLLMPFHAFMMTLGHSAARPIGLSAQEDGRVTDDEAMILTAFAAIANHDISQARLAFMSIAGADSIGVLAHKATLLVGTFSQSKSALQSRACFAS